MFILYKFRLLVARVTDIEIGNNNFVISLRFERRF